MGEVAGDPAGRGNRVILPIPDLRDQIRIQVEGRPLPALGVDHGDPAILTGRSDQAESLLGGHDQAPAAGVVGMLAQDLDPPGGEKRPQPAGT